MPADLPERVLVTGSRTWSDVATVHAALTTAASIHPGMVVVHGACPRGADAITDAWCRTHHVPVERWPADWTRGRSAGPARNAAMVAAGACECLAFIHHDSPGATGCAVLAEQAGIPVRRYRQQPRTARHQAALAAAARGWPVFLLGRTKRPVANCPTCPTVEQDPGHDRQACGCLTCHGFYAATTDPHRIAAMLAAVPAGLLAIRTGAPSGLVVVDIDPDHGGVIDRGLMSPTYTVATGSGGWHLYYTHPGYTVASRQMPGREGVDIKADGGYVVIPPSLHPRTRRPYVPVGDRPVEEMRPRLLAAITAPSAPSPSTPVVAARPTPRTASSGRGRITSPTALLAALLHRVTTAPPGRRRATLYGAAHGVARLIAANTLDTPTGVATLVDAGRAAQQNDRDIRAAIAGAFRDEAVPLTSTDFPGEVA